MREDIRRKGAVASWAAVLLVGALMAGCGGKDAGPKPADPTQPTAAPADPTAAPADPTAAPADPTAAPADPTAAPADPTAAPAEPTAAPAKTVEVTLWHSYRAGEQKAFDQVIEQFNTSQSEVRIRSQAIPYDPFVDKVTITVPRGQGPDLFIFAHNMIGNWVEQGVLEPISGLIPPDELKTFLPDSVKALVYRKNLYGLPLAFKSLVMFYNKKHLPEPPATMDELISKLKAIEDKNVQGLVYQAGGLYFHAMWFFAFGGEVFDADHRPAFDTPAHLQALEYVRKLHFDHKILPKGVSGFMVTSLFNDNNAAVVFNGPWFRPEIGDSVDYGIAKLPSVEGKPLKPMLGIEAVFITKTSKNKEAALKAARYLAGADSAAVRMRVGQQPVCHVATLEAGAAEDPTMRVFMEQALDAVLMDASPEMQLLWTPADIAISAGIFVADRDPKAELLKAQEKMLADIANRGK